MRIISHYVHENLIWVSFSKYTCFDKHTFGQMHYVMDVHNNYVKKPEKVPEQSEPGVHVELEKQYQPEEVLAKLKAPIQDHPAPPPLAVLDTQFVILDELIYYSNKKILPTLFLKQNHFRSYFEN